MCFWAPCAFGRQVITSPHLQHLQYLQLLPHGRQLKHLPPESGAACALCCTAECVYSLHPASTTASTAASSEAATASAPRIYRNCSPHLPHQLPASAAACPATASTTAASTAAATSYIQCRVQQRPPRWQETCRHAVRRSFPTDDYVRAHSHAVAAFVPRLDIVVSDEFLTDDHVRAHSHAPALR